MAELLKGFQQTVFHDQMCHPVHLKFNLCTAFSQAQIKRQTNLRLRDLLRHRPRLRVVDVRGHGHPVTPVHLVYHFPIAHAFKEDNRYLKVLDSSVLGPSLVQFQGHIVIATYLGTGLGRR